MGDAVRVRIGDAIPADWVSKHWYIATVRAGRDEQARAMFEDYDIPVFMLEGCRYVRKGCKGKRLRFEYPVFNGYLFVAASAEAISKAREAKGLLSPVGGWIGGGDGKPMAVNGAVMQSLFVAHEAAIFVPRDQREANRARIKTGDLVEISQGPFQFVQGVVNKFMGANHVEILAECFSGQVTMKIPFDSLEAIGS